MPDVMLREYIEDGSLVRAPGLGVFTRYLYVVQPQRSPSRESSLFIDFVIAYNIH